MAVIEAEIVTPWLEVQVDGQTYREPLVASTFPLLKWQDITGQPSMNIPPTINLLSVLVEAEDTTIAQVILDGRFAVLWAELSTEPYTVPTVGQFRALKDWLEAAGYTKDQLIAALGSTVQGRTRGEIAQALRASLKALLKA